jgi:hypothetical protein
MARQGPILQWQGGRAAANGQRRSTKLWLVFSAAAIINGWASAERLEGGREYPPNFEDGSFQADGVAADCTSRIGWI